MRRGLQAERPIPEIPQPEQEVNIRTSRTLHRSCKDRLPIDCFRWAINIALLLAYIHQTDTERLARQTDVLVWIHPSFRYAETPVRVLEQSSHGEKIAVATVHLIGRRSISIEQELVW